MHVQHDCSSSKAHMDAGVGSVWLTTVPPEGFKHGPPIVSPSLLVRDPPQVPETLHSFWAQQVGSAAACVLRFGRHIACEELDLWRQACGQKLALSVKHCKAAGRLLDRTSSDVTGSQQPLGPAT